MDLKERLRQIPEKIKEAPDSDDICSIVKGVINELIDENIMGLELQLSIHFISQELKRMMADAEDYIEINNLKYGILYTENFKKLLGLAIYPYERN